MSEEIKVFVPEAGKEPSLNQLAIVLGIPAVRLQSAQVAYKPIEGEAYTAKKINWVSVSAFIARRLEKTGYESVEDVYAAAYETPYEPKRVARQKDPNSVWGKVLFGTTPVRKGHVEVGTIIKNKKTDELSKVIFVNDTIVVYDTLAEQDNVVSVGIGNRMFNTNFEIVDEKADA